MEESTDIENKRELRKTRQKSAVQERRNSVSDIKDYFQAKSKENFSPMPQRKASGKTSKEKNKERNKQIQECRENIKSMIKAIDKPDNTDSVKDNANGDFEVEHDESSIQDGPLNEESSQEIIKSNVATQTSQDEILSAISELLSKYKKLEDTVEDPKFGLSAQLAKTQNTVSQLYTDVNGAVSGLKVQMAKVIDTAENNSQSLKKVIEGQRQMATLLDENKRLVQELKVMQGLVHKIANQSTINADNLMDLTKRNMEQNLIIHGVDDSLEKEDERAQTPMFSYRERPKHAAIQFFQQVMNINLEPADIWKAHRTGARKEDKVRPLILKLSYPAKDLVMENISALKDKSNPITKQKYFISEQIPEGVTEKKKQTANRLKHLKDLNEKKPKEMRSKIQVVSDTIIVDDKVDELCVSTPKPSQLFLDPITQAAVDAAQDSLVETEHVTIRNSEFVGFAAKADTIKKVQHLYTAVVQRYPGVDHAMMAYALKQDDQLKTGFCDDREFGAGNRIKKIIFEAKSRDTVVFVLRKYGGVHLGFNRFITIEQVAKDALALLSQNG